MALSRVKTSTTDPIRVDFVAADVHGLPGRIGMTFAPGKSEYGTTAQWDRSLDLDLARLRSEFGAEMLVTLCEDYELDELGIPTLPTALDLHAIRARWYPFPDGFVPPDAESMRALADEVLELMRAGKTVVVHGRSGIRRTPLVVACVLVAAGTTPDAAIDAVSTARPGLALTRLQREFIASFAHAG